MSELMRKIVFYENILEIKENTNSGLYLNEVNNWELCRTCLIETTGDDVGLDNMCVMEVEEGRFLNVKEVLTNLTNLEVTGHKDDVLPFKLCGECLNKIKTFYYFTIQVRKAEKVLKLLAHKLNVSIPIKIEETLTSEEFLLINDDENPKPVKKSANVDILNEETIDIQYISNNGQINDCPMKSTGCPKDSEHTLCKNNQILIKEEPELIIDDLNEEFYSHSEMLQVKNDDRIDKNNELAVDQVNDNFNTNDSPEMHIQEDDYITENATALKSDNKQCRVKLPDFLKHKWAISQKIFNIEPDLAKHTKERHPNVKAFKCRLCDASYSHKQSLYHHYRRTHKIFLTKKPKRPDMIDKKCAVCQKAFSNRPDLVKHAKKIHPKAKAFKCRDCYMVFSNITSVFRHSKRTHKYILKSKKDNSTTNDSQETPENDYVLEKTTEDIQPMFDNKCAACEKIFNCRPDLVKHAKQFHPKVKALKCRDCNMLFSNMNSLCRHNRATHKNVLIRKKHICTFCSQSCYSNADLVNHLRIHTGERPYSCSFCNKTFSLKGSLLGHQNIHQKKTNHICKFCSKSFSLHSRLKMHLRVHTGDLPYTCLLCEKTFAYKYALNRHLKRDHLEQISNYWGVGPTPKFSISDKTCAVCHKTFDTQKDLFKHANQLHPHGKALKCRNCNVLFSLTKSLYRHFNRFHKKTSENISLKEYQRQGCECELCSKYFEKYSLFKRHLRIHTGEPHHTCSLWEKAYENIDLNKQQHIHLEKLSSSCEKNVNISNVESATSTICKENQTNNKLTSINKINETCNFQCPQNSCEINNAQIKSVEVPKESKSEDQIFSNKDKQEIMNSINTHNIEEASIGEFIEAFKTTSVIEISEPKYEYDSTIVNAAIRTEEYSNINDSQQPLVVDNITDERIHLKLKHQTTKYNKRLLQIDSKCAVCDKIFYFQRDLIKHAQQFHPYGRALKCRRCDALFSFQSTLKRHFIKLHKDLPMKIVCKICSKAFYTSSELRCHSRVHSAESSSYSRASAEKTFKEKRNLKLHKQNLKSIINVNGVETNVKCCNENDKIDEHIEFINDSEHSKDTFQSDQSLINNDDEETTNLLNTNISKKLKPDSVSLNTIHMENVVIKKSSELNEGISTTYISQQNRARYNCYQCKRGYKSIRGLQNHSMKSHGTRTVEVAPTIEVQTNSVQGSFPNYKNNNQLLNPIDVQNESEHSEDTYQDGFLNKNEEDEQNKNLKNTNNIPEKLESSNIASLKTETINTDDINKDLSNTNDSSKTQTKRDHRSLHSPFKKTKKQKMQNACTFCSKTFFRSSDLKVHLKIHTGEGGFSCSKCKKSYKFEHDLKNHLESNDCNENINVQNVDQIENIRKRFLDFIKSL